MLPSGAVKLASGAVSLPVDQIVPPQRLVITRIVFTPRRVVTRAPFFGRFRVKDTRGYVVRGALVDALGLQYGWIRPTPEAVTGTDGWATSSSCRTDAQEQDERPAAKRSFASYACLPR